ncbi:hypothetical protein FS837_003022 [Tulasnella sp. UAMH 9824]|nr:hypothetical protein FS837_003022 [Tulasnella sp. UAMH 9824]
MDFNADRYARTIKAPPQANPSTYKRPCNRVRKALGRRGRGHHVSAILADPTPQAMAEHHNAATGPPMTGNKSTFSKLDGWDPEAQPQSTTLRLNPIVGNPHEHARESLSQSRPSLGVPAPVKSTPEEQIDPPPYPGQPEGSDKQKQGNVTETGTEGPK